MQGFTRKRGLSWTAYWSYTDPANGKRRQGSKGGFRLQREAQAHLTSVLPAVQGGSYRPEDRWAVAELLAEWLAAKRSEGLRVGTLTMYGDVIAGWLAPNVGGLPAAQLSPKIAGDLVAKLRSPDGSRLGRGPLSDRSVQLAVQVLTQATRWAWETGRMQRDILAGFKRPKLGGSDRAASAWTAEEAGRFLASVEGERLRALWWLLLTRGLRRGELCGLRWEDVDLDAARLKVVRTRVMTDNVAIDSEPKTAGSRRLVPLDATLAAELRAHRKRQLEERMAAGPAWEESGCVFTNELGAPVFPQFVSRRFATLGRRAGLRPVRLHDGRHSAATMLLEDGTPVHIVSKLLGHARASITLDIYAHAIDGGGEVAGERLTAKLAKQASGDSSR